MNCPDELRADFQQFYHLNVDDLGRAFSVRHAAALAAQLPAGARCPGRAEPSASLTPSEIFLEAIEYNTHVLWWQNSKDGQKNRNKPKPAGLGRPRKRKGVGKGVPLDELSSLLSRPRKDVMPDGERAG